MTILNKAIRDLVDEGTTITPTYSIKYGQGFNLNTGTKAGCLVFLNNGDLVFVRGGREYRLPIDKEWGEFGVRRTIVNQVRYSVDDRDFDMSRFNGNANVCIKKRCGVFDCYE